MEKDNHIVEQRTECQLLNNGKKKLAYHLIHVANTAFIKIFPVNTNRPVTRRQVLISSRD